jgi:hypothetical protein
MRAGPYGAPRLLVRAVPGIPVIECLRPPLQ